MIPTTLTRADPLTAGILTFAVAAGLVLATLVTTLMLVRL